MTEKIFADPGMLAAHGDGGAGERVLAEIARLGLEHNAWELDSLGYTVVLPDRLARAGFTDRLLARVLDESELPTFVERPRLCAVSLSLNQFRVLERALRSPRLQGTFGDLHDFMLVAARGYSYASPPAFASEATECRIIAFTKSELDEVQPRALEAGIHDAAEFVIGCTFSWLNALAAKWPDDEDLRFVPRSTTRVNVHRFDPISKR